METIDDHVQEQQVELTQETKNVIVNAGTWMKVYAITLIVFVSLIGIFGFGLFFIGSLSGWEFFGNNGEGAFPLLLVFAMIIFLIRSISAVYRCSENFSKLPETDFATPIVEGFSYYKSYWVNNAVIIGLLFLMLLYGILVALIFNV